jgi:hypothetical protein
MNSREMREFDSMYRLCNKCKNIKPTSGFYGSIRICVCCYRESMNDKYETIKSKRENIISKKQIGCNVCNYYTYSESQNVKHKESLKHAILSKYFVENKEYYDCIMTHGFNYARKKYSKIEIPNII